MEDKRIQQLKHELRKELRDELKESIEEEVDEELDERRLQSDSRGRFFFSKFKGSFITFLAVIIALGQYSEAVALIGDGIASIRSHFTNDIEYETLEKLHVGNTVAYAEDLLGSPQVSKTINNDIVANYFYHPKYLLTLFYRESRIAAFTYLPLISGFTPSVVVNASQNWVLGSGTFESFPANPQTYTVDHANTASYYIENLDKGRSGLFVNTYLGKVSYSAEDESPLIAALYKVEVTGTDEQIDKAQSALRQSEKPNFYGEGELSLELIEKGILTGAQFKSYFGHQ